MMIQAVLGNPHHPEYGVATIPFPIPHDQYAHCMELLEALEIGDAVKADCQVQEINSFYSVLKRTEMLTVNVEELNYLAKRLDSFDTGEAAQFQAMAHKLELFELKDLINLTFCCQQATVITDFSDLSAVGRDHYMNLHGGSAKTEQLDALDGEETARRLIESGSGTITPYGVVYDNGMKLEQVYDGRFFPCYYYEPNAITVAVTSKAEPEDTEHITWLFLPMVQEEIDRALQRAGIKQAAAQNLSKSELLRMIEDSAHLESVLDEKVDVWYNDDNDEISERTQYEEDPVYLSWKYLPQPHGRVCDEGLGKKGGTGIAISYRIGGYQSGGDRQPGLSSGTAQVGRAWDLVRRPCRTAVDKSGLRRIRSPDRHGPGQPPGYVPHLRRRLCRQDVPPDGPHRSSRQCGGPMVHRGLRGDLARCAGGLPRTFERIHDRTR